MADGIVQIERLINSSPQFAGREVHVKAFPGGFPADLTALEDADTVLPVFSGIPGIRLPMRRTEKVFADLMARGVGLISLHQSFTVPADSSDIPFAEWLGATRRRHGRPHQRAYAAWRFQARRMRWARG